jgi:hypothetical protein
MAQKKKRPRQAAAQQGWRRFEVLISQIEKALGPLEAVVKSPDKVPELVSGDLREVDASIRYKVGSVPLLITIECRKRSRKDDVTWIEQLATKRKSIGASRTIAVSARGFSRAATEAARLHGIETRRLGTVGLAEVLDLMGLEAIEHHRRMFDILGATFFFGPGNDIVRNPDVLEKMNGPEGDKLKLFRIVGSGTLLSVYDFFRATMALFDTHRGIPTDGRKYEIVRGLLFNDGSVSMETADGVEFVTRMEVEASVWYERMPATAEGFAYSDASVPIGHGVSHKVISADGTEMLMTMCKETDSDEIKFSYVAVDGSQG